MNEQESISIIKDMIANSKQNIKDQSPYYLWWGSLVFIAAIVEYILFVFMESSNHWWVWPIMSILGGLGSGIIGWRQEKRATVKTFIDRAMNYVWGGWIMIFLITVIWAAVSGVNWAQIFTIIIAFYGVGTFISGGILRFKPLMIGGLISLFIAVLCILFRLDQSFPNMLIALALSILVSYLIPGFLLRKA